MHRLPTTDFIDSNPTPAASPALNPGAFVMCPVVLMPACPMQQFLWHGLYQMAYQQAVEHCAPPRLPRFSMN